MEMMEAARLRLQARYDKDALRAEEKRQEAEDRAGDQGVGGSPGGQGLQEQVTEVCCHTNLLTLNISSELTEAVTRRARLWSSRHGSRARRASDPRITL